MIYKILTFIVLISAISACGPDFYIMNTDFIVLDGAEPPCDLADVYREMRSEISSNLRHISIGTSTKTVSKIFRTTVILRPSWNPPNSIYYPNLGVVDGLYEPDAIQVRLIGNSILDSALIHEFAAHRVPDILFQDENARHDTKYKKFERTIRQNVVNKTSGICSIN